jgi:hypothetical protein
VPTAGRVGGSAAPNGCPASIASNDTGEPALGHVELAAKLGDSVLDGHDRSCSSGENVIGYRLDAPTRRAYHLEGAPS